MFCFTFYCDHKYHTTTVYRTWIATTKPNKIKTVAQTLREHFFAKPIPDKIKTVANFA